MAPMNSSRFFSVQQHSHIFSHLSIIARRSANLGAVLEGDGHLTVGHVADALAVGVLAHL